MHFYNPWGFLAFLSVPLLILFYILKQRHQEQMVSSTYLWERSQLLMQASAPWQKLRKSLLFFLQLLLLVCLSLALTRPVIQHAGTAQEYIMMIDSSASMRSGDRSPSRFAMAVREVEKQVDRLLPGQCMSIIQVGDNVSLLVSRSADKQMLHAALRGMECGYGTADVQAAVALAGSLRIAEVSTQVVFYTDKEYRESGEISIVNLCEKEENTAVTGVSSVLTEKGYTILSTVQSSGGHNGLTLELYCDGVLFDARSVDCPAGEPVHTYWQSVPVDASFVSVRIVEEDALAADNERFLALQKQQRQRVLLVSEQSLFWEKVLLAVGSYEISKTTREQMEGRIGYDLYLLDGFVPDSLPTDGAVWLICPDRDPEGLRLGASIKGTSLTAAVTKSGQALSRYVTADHIVVAQFLETLSVTGWEPSFLCGELPVVLTKTSETSTNLSVFLFDLHHSNLPLLKEFPILIQNLLSYTLPSVLDGSGQYVSGEAVEVRALPFAKSISVVDPAGFEQQLAPPFPPGLYVTGKPGLYQIRQTVEHTESRSEEYQTYFTVQIPAGESLTGGNESLELGESRMKTAESSTELWPFLLLLAAAAALVEWRVYYRGNSI